MLILFLGKYISLLLFYEIYWIQQVVTRIYPRHNIYLLTLNTQLKIRANVTSRNVNFSAIYHFTSNK